MLLVGGKEETAGLICDVVQIMGQPLALGLVSGLKKSIWAFHLKYSNLTSW